MKSVPGFRAWFGSELGRDRSRRRGGEGRAWTRKLFPQLLVVCCSRSGIREDLVGGVDTDEFLCLATFVRVGFEDEFVVGGFDGRDVRGLGDAEDRIVSGHCFFAYTNPWLAMGGGGYGGILVMKEEKGREEELIHCAKSTM